MDDIDRTYEALIRTPFQTVVQEIYDADPWGSYTFNKLNSDQVWRVSSSFEDICIKHGWTLDEFNKQVDKHFNEQ